MSRTGAARSPEGTRRERRALASLIVVGALAYPGCGGTAPSPSAPASTPRTPGPAAEKPGAVTTTDYSLKGVVRSVAPESGRVLIRHGAIPGFMDAMTMPFQPDDESILGLLRPGDEVEGILRVEKKDGAVVDYQLRDLKVVKAAATRPLVLDGSKGKAKLQEPPPRLKVGEAVPDFTMTGQDGESLKLSDLRGRVVVLTFIYTRCPMPDFCPLMDRKFSDLARHLEAFPERAKEIRMISLSFDPEHDTPEVLRKHAAIRGAVPPLWGYAVASHEELAKIAPRLGLIFGPNGQEIAHNLCTAVIDPAGKLARLEVGKEPNRWDTADFLRTIYALLPGGAK